MHGSYSGWQMLAAAVFLSPGTPWRPEFSDRLDRLITEQRQRDAAQRRGLGLGPSAVRVRPNDGVKGMPRGEATAEEVARRRRADRALARLGTRPSAELSAKRRFARSMRPGTVRWPQPKQKPNGRWLAKCIEAGQLHTRTFDTKQEAEHWIREIKGSKAKAHNNAGG